jgi:mannose-1-phosphate guanylyltransferase
MQALILAGGEGTRLRPLTTTTPKPVLPLAGRPFLTYMIDWLARHGVDDVVLSCGFMSRDVQRVLGDIRGGVRLRYVHEDEPLGTAGPVRLAESEGVLDQRFLVLNGDVLSDMDVTAQLAQHDRTGARVTLALIEVEDTSGYGVVPTDPDGRVEAFLEKTTGAVPTNRVNAGCYVVEREVVSMIAEGRASSFEREVFPRLVGDGLFGFMAAGYWIDIGTPERYLRSTWDLLAGVVESDLPPRDESGSLIYEPCITMGARIGPQAVVGPHCSIGAGAEVERAVLMDGVMVGSDAVLRECVVASGARLGERARVEPGAVVGAGARLAAGAVVERDARVQPGAEIA